MRVVSQDLISSSCCFVVVVFFLLINLFVLRVNRAVGIKSGPSLTEHVHPDLASSAKLVRRSKLNFLLQSKASDPDD